MKSDPIQGVMEKTNLLGDVEANPPNKGPDILVTQDKQDKQDQQDQLVNPSNQAKKGNVSTQAVEPISTTITRVSAFDNKVFSIGFGKCGTRSMHLFLKLKNGVTSVHGGRYMKYWFIRENLHRIQNRAQTYIYDSMSDPFNIKWTLRHFPNSYYVLPTRGFLGWFVSVITHFRFTTINPSAIHRSLLMRNQYYEQVRSSNIKNFLMVNVEKEDLCLSLVAFLPPNMTKKYKGSFMRNVTRSILKNKEEIKVWILGVLAKMGVSEENANSPFIVYDKNNSYDIKMTPELCDMNNPENTIKVIYN